MDSTLAASAVRGHCDFIMQPQQVHRVSNQQSGIVADGLQRLLRSAEFRQKRAAIGAEVRAEYAVQLDAATDYWQRVSAEATIRRETQRRIKALVPSPYALWSFR